MNYCKGDGICIIKSGLYDNNGNDIFIKNINIICNHNCILNNCFICSISAPKWYMKNNKCIECLFNNNEDKMKLD